MPINNHSRYGELHCQCRGCGETLTVFVGAGKIRAATVELVGRHLIHKTNGVSRCGGTLAILGGGVS